MPYDDEYSEGWDCDPFAIIAQDIDDRDEESDWQSICLDRWGDRLVNGE